MPFVIRRAFLIQAFFKMALLVVISIFGDGMDGWIVSYILHKQDSKGNLLTRNHVFMKKGFRMATLDRIYVICLNITRS